MNYVSLIGRLTKDPELKYSQSGKAFCKFTIAVTREFNREEADFINCVAWDKRAETIAEYLKKGRRIAVQGRLQTGSYEKDGRTIYTTDIIVDKFTFIDFNDEKENESEKVSDDDDFPF